MAVLAADAAGYSRLMAEDDVATVAELDDARAAFRRHITAQEGRVIDMAGDSVLAGFDDTTAAVRAAIAIQHELARRTPGSSRQPRRLKFRIGIHAGDVIEQPDGSIYGDCVNVAARLQALAEPAGINVSRAVREAVRGEEALGFDDLGEYAVKNIARPVHTFAVRLGGGVSTQGHQSAQSAQAAHNLPEPLTSFVGRQSVIADIGMHFGRERLITLTGPGGSGKTRLTNELARRWLGDLRDGAHLVELAPLSDASLVPQAVAGALGLRERPGQALLDTVCEHLIGACAELADAVLRRCRGTMVLASSREPLAVEGELVYKVPPLSTPDVDDASPERLLHSEAVRLFVERVRLHKLHFVLDEHNAAAVASICRRLDGMPLAIELAAARVRAMSVHEIAQRLDKRLKLLVGGPRTVMPRQQTLRAMIDWSYELLDGPERALWARASVFAGSWTVEAAEQVCAGDVIEAHEVLDLLSMLADKSLLVTESIGGITHYRMLETMREYAQERLTLSGDLMPYARRHADYFVAFAAKVEPLLLTSEQKDWFERLGRMHDNLRAALAHWSGPQGDAATALCMAASLRRFWFVRGHFAEARRWLSDCLAAAPEPTSLRAKALSACGEMARTLGDNAHAERLLREAVAIARQLGDPLLCADSLNDLALAVYQQSRFPESRTLAEEALSLQRTERNQRGIAQSLNLLGMACCDQGDNDLSQRLHREALAIRRELGDRQGIAMSLNNLALALSRQRDFVTARRLYEENLEIRRDLGDKRGIAMSLLNLGTVAQDTGDMSAAESMINEAMPLFRELGDRKGIGYGLFSLGQLATRREAHAAALKAYEESASVHRQTGDQAGLAMSLEGLALSHAALDDPLRAARLWGAAGELCRRLGIPSPVEEPDRQRSMAAARASVPSQAFDDCLREGA
ncbi:MAG TPA: tetratricopeptide repeat protein, partial [Burkholderiaceae bacterium]|nr:tetratricopeptide repeat protein [Burkholderiaceae bacterium]